MNPVTASPSLWSPASIGCFLRSDTRTVRNWVTECPTAAACFCVGVIIAGAGMYGTAMGSWRNGWQALCTGIKLPLVILITTLGNGLLNAMLAPLLGLNIRFRLCQVLLLVSFAMASLVLAGLAPIAWFVVWNTPPLDATTSLSSPEYGLLQLTLAGFLASAGIIGNVRLLPLLKAWGQTEAVAMRVLLAWLAVNLFLGSQIAWVLRPFIWDPAGPVEFIGRQYFHGSFYETVFEAARRLILR